MVVICNSKDDFASKQGQALIQTFFFLFFFSFLFCRHVSCRSFLSYRTEIGSEWSPHRHNLLDDEWIIRHQLAPDSKHQIRCYLSAAHWAAANTVTNTADEEGDSAGDGV